MHLRFLLPALFVIIFFSLIGVGLYGLMLLQPVGGQGQRAEFIVQKGESFSAVATRLADEGYIRSALVLRFLARQQAQVPVIHPGTFEIASTMTPQQILEVLQADTQDVWVTLLEGWRVEEMAQELDANLPDTFDKETFLALAKEKEGRMFPDTYLFAKASTAQTVVSVLENTFKKRYQSLLQEVPEPAYPQDKAVILASLIQREAKTAAEMKVVAGILKNRLDDGMPLQVDATLQYIKGYDAVQQTWWPEPRSVDKDLISPYNTYANQGLPPSPISNPGLDALRAAVDPDRTEYYYYISDRTGKLHYAKTYAEHLKLIDQYLR